METQMTISCLQCEWSVEAVNTSVQASTAFLEAAHSHVDQHEQHALEVVQRLRLYSENYVGPRRRLPLIPQIRGLPRPGAMQASRPAFHGQVEPRTLTTI